MFAALRADPEAGNLRFPVTPPFGWVPASRVEVGAKEVQRVDILFGS